jgi:hypothetical protein
VRAKLHPSRAAGQLQKSPHPRKLTAVARGQQKRLMPCLGPLGQRPNQTYGDERENARIEDNSNHVLKYRNRTANLPHGKRSLKGQWGREKRQIKMSERM